MAAPLLSVIIPTYNRSTYLCCAVESVLAQVGVEVDVIIVDDGSTDATAAVVERHAARWGTRVRYLWQERAERGAARNRGLAQARGEYVAFLDSDDVWRPWHAQRCLDALRRVPQAVGVYSDCGQIDPAGRVIRNRVPRPRSRGRTFLRDLCLKRLILHPTEVVLRRAWLGTDPFDPEIPGAEDWLLWVSLARHGGFESVGEPTVWMRVHPHGTFGDPSKFTRSLMMAAERVIATGMPERLDISGARILTINRIHCAYAYYLDGQWAAAASWLRSALRTSPAALRESDFWQVLVRLGAGRSCSRRLRTLRQRARGAMIPSAQPLES